MGDGEVGGLLGGRGASLVGMSVQNILLGDGSEREFDRLNLDLMSLTVLAFLHGDSKGEESVREDGRHLNFAGGILVEPATRNAFAMPSSSDAAWIHPQLQCQSLPTQHLEDVVSQPAGHRC